MGKAISIKVEGVGLLERNLLRLVTATTGKPLDDATEEATTVLEELQEVLAPRDRGTLAANIERQRHKATTNFSEWDTGPGKRGFHGMFQEFGTIYHAPQPFMRPSFDSGKGTAEREFKSRLFRGIRRAVRRG